MSRILVISAAFILVGTVLAIILGLQELFTKTTVDGQFSGFLSLWLWLILYPYSFNSFQERRKVGLVYGIRCWRYCPYWSVGSCLLSRLCFGFRFLACLITAGHSLGNWYSASS